jgi:hypothetical protein
MSRFLFKHNRDSDAFHQNSAQLSKLSNEVAYSFLKANLHEDDFLVWGWATSYYNEFPVHRVSGFMYPQFNMGYFVGKQVTNQLTISELNNHKTKYIIELVGSERPYFKSRKEQGIDKVDSLLSKYIADHYRVIIDSMDTRIFVRNEISDVN